MDTAQTTHPSSIAALAEGLQLHGYFADRRLATAARTSSRPGSSRRAKAAISSIVR